MTNPTSKEETYRRALTRIAKWFGEFPDTGRTWEDGSPMSYSACWGSNGERDFMRNVAIEALAKAQHEPSAPETKAHISKDVWCAMGLDLHCTCRNCAIVTSQFTQETEPKCADYGAPHYDSEPCPAAADELNCQTCGKPLDEHAGMGLPCPLSATRDPQA